MRNLAATLIFCCAAACGGREFSSAPPVPTDDAPGGDAVAFGDVNADGGDVARPDASPEALADGSRADDAPRDVSPAADADASPSDAARADDAADASPLEDADASSEDADADGSHLGGDGAIPCGPLNSCPVGRLCYSGICR